MLSSRRLVPWLALFVCGCGQRIVDGEYPGDAALHLNGIMEGDVGQPLRGMVGAAWIGYAGLVVPLMGLETATLPISSGPIFPPRLAFDALDAPPSAGQYLLPDGSLVPARVRLGRLIVFDDIDSDGTFSIGDDGRLRAPDRLLAMATQEALLFVEQPPANPAALDRAQLLIGNWEAAKSYGFHLVHLDGPPATPDLAAHVIAPTTAVTFRMPDDLPIW
jgi:hypothetical protein